MNMEVYISVVLDNVRGGIGIKMWWYDIGIGGFCSFGEFGKILGR